MNKFINTFFLLIVIIFFISLYKYYSSNTNIETKSYNRNNINEIISTKISDLPILINDTDDVIIFNDGLSNTNNKKKKRSFWNLLKFK